MTQQHNLQDLTSVPQSIRKIIQDFLAGMLSQQEAEDAISKTWTAYQVSPQQRQKDLTDWYAVLQSTPTDKNPGSNQGSVLNPKPVPLTGSALEGQTDPLTAYLSRLGIGSKQNYNPGEAYQASLFDPYKSQYDIQNRTAGLLNPSKDTANGPGSFSDFLDRLGGGGMQGLISGAQGQLKNIFGATSDQKTSTYNPTVGKFGLGYEPGQGAVDKSGFAPSMMDAGQIGELQDLLKYGLRGQTNQDAAAWAAKRLPGAQQAYYGQKAAGQLGDTNFVDWLKQNWGLQF